MIQNTQQFANHRILLFFFSLLSFSLASPQQQQQPQTNRTSYSLGKQIKNSEGQFFYDELHDIGIVISPKAKDNNVHLYLSLSIDKFEEQKSIALQNLSENLDDYILIAQIQQIVYPCKKLDKVDRNVNGICSIQYRNGNVRQKEIRSRMHQVEGIEYEPINNTTVNIYICGYNILGDQLIEVIKHQGEEEDTYIQSTIIQVSIPISTTQFKYLYDKNNQISQQFTHKKYNLIYLSYLVSLYNTLQHEEQQLQVNNQSILLAAQTFFIQSSNPTQTPSSYSDKLNDILDIQKELHQMKYSNSIQKQNKINKFLVRQSKENNPISDENNMINDNDQESVIRNYQRIEEAIIREYTREEQNKEFVNQQRMTQQQDENDDSESIYEMIICFITYKGSSQDIQLYQYNKLIECFSPSQRIIASQNIKPLQKVIAGNTNNRIIIINPKFGESEIFIFELDRIGIIKEMSKLIKDQSINTNVQIENDQLSDYNNTNNQNSKNSSNSINNEDYMNSLNNLNNGYSLSLIKSKSICRIKYDYYENMLNILDLKEILIILMQSDYSYSYRCNIITNSVSKNIMPHSWKQLPMTTKAFAYQTNRDNEFTILQFMNKQDNSISLAIANHRSMLDENHYTLSIFAFVPTFLTLGIIIFSILKWNRFKKVEKRIKAQIQSFTNVQLSYYQFKLRYIKRDEYMKQKCSMYFGNQQLNSSSIQGGEIYIDKLQLNKNYLVKQIKMQSYQNEDYVQEYIKTHLSLYKYNGVQQIKHYCILPESAAIIVTPIPKRTLQSQIESSIECLESFDDQTLLKIAKDLIETLSIIQTEMNLAHRDIKPNSIILDSDGKYKLTNFRPRHFHLAQNYMLILTQGSMAFMAPQVRFQIELQMSNINYDPENVDYDEGNEFQKLSIGEGNFLDFVKNDDDIHLYNSFKSDVFSLGLTLLLAATKHGIDGLNINKDLLNSRISKFKSAPNFSDLVKNLITSMLQWEEEDRPKFDELLELINQN